MPLIAQNSSGSLVLMYHRIGSPLVRSIVRGQYVHPMLLEWQLATLRRKGYQPTPLKDAVADPSRGANTFSVTFDDGYASVGRLAFPILLNHDIPFTIFMVAGLLGKSNEWDQRIGDRVEPLLSPEKLRSMASVGVEIASHSMTHARLTELSDADLRAEVHDSKHRLEDMLGKSVVGFSYPYGAVDERVREEVMSAGYRYATTTKLGNFTADTDHFMIPRLNMRWNTVGFELRQKIKRASRNVQEAINAYP